MDSFVSSADGLPARSRPVKGGEAAAGQDSAIISAIVGRGRPIQDVTSNIGLEAELEQL